MPSLIQPLNTTLWKSGNVRTHSSRSITVSASPFGFTDYPIGSAAFTLGTISHVTLNGATFTKSVAACTPYPTSAHKPIAPPTFTFWSAFDDSSWLRLPMAVAVSANPLIFVLKYPISSAAFTFWTVCNRPRRGFDAHLLILYYCWHSFIEYFDLCITYCGDISLDMIQCHRLHSVKTSRDYRAHMSDCRTEIFPFTGWSLL